MSRRRALRRRYGRARFDVPGSKQLAARFPVRRIRLDRGGYASGGRYYGSGAPLFSVYDEDTGKEHVTRARDAREARAKAIEAWSRSENWSGEYGRKVWGPFVETKEERFYP